MPVLNRAQVGYPLKNPCCLLLLSREKGLPTYSPSTLPGLIPLWTLHSPPRTSFDLARSPRKNHGAIEPRRRNGEKTKAGISNHGDQRSLDFPSPSFGLSRACPGLPALTVGPWASSLPRLICLGFRPAVHCPKKEKTHSSRIEPISISFEKEKIIASQKRKLVAWRFSFPARRCQA